MMHHTPPRALELDGWVSWQLIDARTGRVEAEGEQHNLFLNQGLDLLPVYGLGGDSTTLDEQTGVAQYLVVGTGTADPLVTQTVMGAELARTNFAPFAFTFGRVADGTYRRTVTREFTEAQANGNLAEWGWAAGSNGLLAVRERFRDASNNPIVLTKTNTQRLRMSYTLEYRFGPLINTPAAFTVAGVGNLTGTYSLHRQSDGQTLQDDCDYHAVNSLLMAQASGTRALLVGILKARGTAPSYATIGGDRGNPATYSTAIQGGFTAPAYVAGSYARAVSLTFGTGQGNVVHYGWTLAGIARNVNGTNYAQPGYTLQLNAGSEITTKDNLKTLTVSGVGLSWGRV